MTTLARGISATTTILDVSDETLNVARPFLATLDSETVRVRGLEYVSGAATRWNVDRGIDSTPATHAGGATVTLGDAAGEEAILPSKDFYAQDTDPGAVGTGSVWKDTAAAPEKWWRRNPTNDGWEADFSPFAVSVGDADAYAITTANAPGTGNASVKIAASADGIGTADASQSAISVGGIASAGALANGYDVGSADVSGTAFTELTGLASAGMNATADGSGDANVVSQATANTGSALSGSMATRQGLTAGVYGEVDDNGVAKLGFNAVAASGGVTIPELPATPTEQDIADVLVALGLVTQAA